MALEDLRLSDRWLAILKKAEVTTIEQAEELSKLTDEEINKRVPGCGTACARDVRNAIAEYQQREGDRSIDPSEDPGERPPTTIQAGFLAWLWKRSPKTRNVILGLAVVSAVGVIAWSAMPTTIQERIIAKVLGESTHNGKEIQDRVLGHLLDEVESLKGEVADLKRQLEDAAITQSELNEKNEQLQTLNSRLEEVAAEYKQKASPQAVEENAATFEDARAVVRLAQISMSHAAARRQGMKDRLRRIGVALMSYQEMHGRLPPSQATLGESDEKQSWRAAILPFVEPDYLDLEKYELSKPWDAPSNRELFKRVPDVYSSGVAIDDSWTNVVAIVGPNTAFGDSDGDNSENPTNINQSRSALVMEVGVSGFHWMEPKDFTLKEAVEAIMMGNSCSQGGSHILFPDGTVHFIPQHSTQEYLFGLLADGT